MTLGNRIKNFFGEFMLPEDNQNERLQVATNKMTIGGKRHSEKEPDLTVKVKYVDGFDYKIERHGDFFDLATKEVTHIKKGDLKQIGFGVAMELPEGYYAEIAPRSSTARKWGILLSNSIGIIDNGYNGPDDWWSGFWYAIRDTTIPKGTRIAQFRLVRTNGDIDFIEDTLDGNSNRGGFGSSGN